MKMVYDVLSILKTEVTK